MLPYWLLFAFFALGSLASPPNPPGRVLSRPLLWLGGAIVALMIGLRYQVGGDWLNYLEIFRHATYLDAAAAAQLIDPAFGLLNWLAGQLGLGVVFITLVIAVIFAVGLISFAREQPQPWIAVLIAVPYLIIVVAMGYTRQGAAIGLIFLALTERNRRSPLRLILLVLLATAFHRSAIVIVPILLMAAARSRVATLFATLATLAIAYDLLVASSVDTLFTNYIVARYDSSGAAVRVALNIPPALIYLRMRDRLVLDEASRRLWTNFAVASLISLILLLVTPSTTAVDRLALYLIPLQMFVFARLGVDERIEAPVRRELVWGMIAYSALIQFVWLNYATNSWAWLPYRMAPFVDA